MATVQSKTAIVQVSFEASLEDRRRVKAAAKAADKTTSAWLRGLVIAAGVELDEVKPVGNPALRKGGE